MSKSCGRLSLEDLIAFGQGNPGLLAAGPDVPFGRSHDVSSSVPARTRCNPSLGVPQIQVPHSGQTRRVFTRPLSAVRCSGRGSTPLSRNAVSGITTPMLNALLVRRWQSVQWHVYRLRGFGDLVADFAALAPAGLWELHARVLIAAMSEI